MFGELLWGAVLLLRFNFFNKNKQIHQSIHNCVHRPDYDAATQNVLDLEITLF